MNKILISIYRTKLFKVLFEWNKPRGWWYELPIAILLYNLQSFINKKMTRYFGLYMTYKYFN